MVANTSLQDRPTTRRLGCLDAKGYRVDVKGYSVDVKGYSVDAKGCIGAFVGQVQRQTNTAHTSGLDDGNKLDHTQACLLFVDNLARTWH
eukprot:402341-Pyramimonas_sp.AAC.2